MGNKDEDFRKAAVILESAIQFLADKHGVTTADVWASVIAKHEKVCTQLAEVLTWAIEEVQKNKA